jgi:hypothetical protein
MEFTHLWEDKRDVQPRAAKNAVASMFSREEIAGLTIVRDESRSRFLVFKSRAEMIAAYTKLDRRFWHEVILGNVAQRLKVDFDATPELLAAIPESVLKKAAPATNIEDMIDVDDVIDELFGDSLLLQVPQVQPQKKEEPPAEAERAYAALGLILDAVLASLEKLYGIMATRRDIALSSSSGLDAVKGYKHSYHALVLPYAVRDCVEAQAFTEHLAAQLPPQVRALIDTGVNRSTQCFRMELSAKVKSPGRVKIASDEVADSFGTAAGLGPAELLVTAGAGMRILPSIAGEKADARAGADGTLSQASIDATLEIAADAVRGFRLREARGTLLTFQRVAPSRCRLCAETHHNDSTLMLTLAADMAALESAADPATLIACGVIERCRQRRERRAELGTVWVAAGELLAAGVAPRPRNAAERAAATAGAAERALQRHIADITGGRHDPHAAAASQFENLPPAQTIIYNEPAMRSYSKAASPDSSPPGAWKTLAVRGGMGVGKTKALREYIDAHFPAGARPVIRFVTFRQTFGRALQGNFPDFALYSDAPAGASLGAVEYPRLIVQVESLHRLPAPRGADGIVDLLVLDEVESILAQFNSGLHRNFAAAFAIFRWMMANARHVVAMDANLSDRTWAVLADMRPAHPPVFHWNRFARAAGDRFEFTGDLGAWLTRLRGALRARRRVVIPTNSLAEARALEAEIRQEFPDRAVTLYSSEMAPSERATHFANVHEYWGKLDVLIYTPTCSAGVSFELAHFDELFGLFTDKSCDVETCRQMLGRVRNLRTREHHICFQAAAGPRLPESTADIRARLRDKRSSLYRDAAAGPFAALGFEYDPEGMPGFYETPFFRLWLETTRIENLSKNDFARRFIDQVADSGATVAPWTAPAVDEAPLVAPPKAEAPADAPAPPADAPADPSSTALVAAHRSVRKQQREQQHEVIAAAADLLPDEAEDVRTSMSVGADVSPELRAALEKWHLRVTYSWHGRPIDADFVAHYGAWGARRVYRNLTLATSGATVEAALVAAAASESNRFSLSMGLRTEATAAAIEGRELLRDQLAYPAFGLLLALWLLTLCGFEDFLDIRFVHVCALEARLRSALPALEAQYPRILSEFEDARVTDFSRLRREPDSARFLAGALRLINAALRAAFGVQVSCICAAAGADAYHVTQSPVGKLFAFAGIPAGEPMNRPLIPCALKNANPVPGAAKAAALALFMDRLYYSFGFDIDT